MNSLPELPFWEASMKREILDQNWMLCLRPLSSSFAIPSKLFWVFQLVSLKQWYCLVVICPFPALLWLFFPPLITIKKPHNYYSQSCPLLGSVCEFNFFLSLYIWELHSLRHPASLFLFLSVFHSHSWNRRINLVSDVPFFSFKKISLLLQRTWIWKESAGAISCTSCIHEKERAKVNLKQFNIYLI